jgi:L-ribulose-5-phosphate 3-epimerase
LTSGEGDVNPEKIGVALWSLGPTRTVEELERSLQTTAATGFRGVQPWCVDDCVLDPDRCTGAQRGEMLRRIQGHGLAISGFCAQLSGPTRFGGLDEEDGLAARVAKTQRCLELAAELGAPVVTTHPGSIPADESQPAYQTLLRACEQIARHGERAGGIFCIETGQEPAHVLRAFLERIGSPALKVNYDPANMLRHGVVDGVRTLAPWIVHTHAKDDDPATHRATLGQGAVPWGDYLAALAAIGYDGWFAVEDETGKDVEASLRTGRAFLEQQLRAGIGR